VNTASIDWQAHRRQSLRKNPEFSAACLSTLESLGHLVTQHEDLIGGDVGSMKGGGGPGQVWKRFSTVHNWQGTGDDGRHRMMLADPFFC